jgi:hypothetical protein
MTGNTAPGPDLGSDLTWERLLQATIPGQHVVQLYSNGAFLARAVGRYLGEGLRMGEAALLVATASHGRAVMRRLRDAGLPLHDLARRRQLILLEADRTLGELLVDGAPDRARFRAVIGRAVRAIKTAGYARIRAFGEMVDLLRLASLEEALHLETLWNELLVEDRISLLCAYAIDVFDRRSYGGVLERVAAAHSHLVPVEDYARLDAAVERAYGDVFGAGGDGAYLRRAFVRHYPKPAAMPDAQAALLAALEFMPATASLILCRARQHYGPADHRNGGAARPAGAGPSGEATERPEI